MGSSKENMMFEALKCGNEDKVEDLLKNGVNVNAKDKDGNTFLYYALYFGNPEVIDLFKGTCNADKQYDMLTFIWDESYFSRRLNVIKLLLDNGVNINEQNNNGDTLLMVHSRWGNTKIVRELINWGADPNITNENEETALDLASEEKVIKILKKKAAENLQNPVQSVIYHTNINTSNYNADEKAGYQIFNTGQTNLMTNAELESKLQSKDREIKELKMEITRLTGKIKYLETELRRKK